MTCVRDDHPFAYPPQREMYRRMIDAEYVRDRLITAHAESERTNAALREGIRRYMADDPPCAADCASMDPHPSRGPCDCGVNDFLRLALADAPAPALDGRE